MSPDIVSDAREWLDGYAGRESTHSAECHKWHHACLVARLVDEIERLLEQKNLTDEERSAVEYYIGTGGPDSVDATLVALLSRTGKNLRQTSDNATECRDWAGKCPERERLEELRAAADQADAEYRDEIARLRLTAAEREAIEVACQDLRHTEEVATLRGLLERLQSDGSGYTHGIPAGAGAKSTLTQEEREAVERAADLIDAKTCGDSSTLRELLERLV